MVLYSPFSFFSIREDGVDELSAVFVEIVKCLSRAQPVKLVVNLLAFSASLRGATMKSQSIVVILLNGQTADQDILNVELPEECGEVANQLI